MESIETVSQQKEQYINMNNYEEGKKKGIWMGWVRQPLTLGPKAQPIYGFFHVDMAGAQKRIWSD